jgi:hypothetical protein
MNDNHTGHAVLSPLFAQNLVQRLEQLNNVDQFTDTSNMALPSRCFSSSRPIRQLLHQMSLRLCWESVKGMALLPLPPLRTGLDGFHHPAQSVCKPSMSRTGKTHRTTVVDACWLT